MELASKLWAAGLKAEFGFKPNPKMGDQLGYALEQGIPLMVLFGDEEIKKGEVKVKDMAAKSEDAVAVEDLVDDLKRRVALLPTGLGLVLGATTGGGGGGAGGGRSSGGGGQQQEKELVGAAAAAQ
jgi:hypothetical protein